MKKLLIFGVLFVLVACSPTPYNTSIVTSKNKRDFKDFTPGVYVPVEEEPDKDATLVISLLSDGELKVRNANPEKNPGHFYLRLCEIKGSVYVEMEDPTHMLGTGAYKYMLGLFLKEKSTNGNIHVMPLLIDTEKAEKMGIMQEKDDAFLINNSSLTPEQLVEITTDKDMEEIHYRLSQKMSSILKLKKP